MMEAAAGDDLGPAALSVEGTGMGRNTEGDAAAAHTNGAEPHKPVERTQLSPRIRELILRFTLLDGSATFDRTALERGPLPLRAR
jgi:hypothetical protein